MKHPPLLRPKKSLGQNFLRDPNIARKIVTAIDAQPEDVILEIGPGEGALTKHLFQRAGKLVVVDIDERIIGHLETTYTQRQLEILHEDVLETDISQIAGRYRRRLRIVGNIPYNITTPILFHLLDHRAHVSDIILMVQREVALRMVAKQNTKEYGILSVMCQFFADVQLLFKVSANAFYPKPNVTSAVVRLALLGGTRYAVLDVDFFRRMVRSIFGKRRKTLRNSLKYFVEEVGAGMPTTMDLQRRPEELSIRELAELSNTVFASMSHA